MTDPSKSQERSGRRRRRLLSPVQKYEAFVQVLTGEMTVAECADHWVVSGGREPPPPALLEPYVTVSRHTAPTVRRGVGARRCQ